MAILRPATETDVTPPGGTSAVAGTRRYSVCGVVSGLCTGSAVIVPSCDRHPRGAVHEHPPAEYGRTVPRRTLPPPCAPHPDAAAPGSSDRRGAPRLTGS